MKDIIDRLSAMSTETDKLMDEIKKQVEDGHLLTSGLWNIQSGIESTIGALLGQAHAKGKITYSEEGGPA